MPRALCISCISGLRQPLAHSVTLMLCCLALVSCQTLSPRLPAPATATETLLIYSGRNENLLAPLVARFQVESGMAVQVRYGVSTEMVATLIEEGQNSPADLFFAQEVGALGTLSRAGRFVPLPKAILDQVDPAFRSRQGDWIGTSGRARVLLYNSERRQAAELPADVWGLTTPAWRGQVGWAPTNGNFQSFVTALRILEGEERARAWLQAMVANEVHAYPNQTNIVEAVIRGEIEAGLINHYYMYRFLSERGQALPIRNHHFPTPGAGSMINVAGVGILDTARNPAAATAFVAYLFTPTAQHFFTAETNEYPLVPGTPVNPLLPPLESLTLPAIDLGQLDDLAATLVLLQEVGVLD